MIFFNFPSYDIHMIVIPPSASFGMNDYIEEIKLWQKHHSVAEARTQSKNRKKQIEVCKEEIK